MIEPKKTIWNPSQKELREMARKDEITTEFGSAAYISRVRSRSAKFTKNTIDDEITEEDREEIEKAKEYMKEQEMICVDRHFGQKLRFNCRLYITKDYARVAYAWGSLMLPVEGEPDFITIAIPEWKKIKILVDPESGITYILGSDYTGEVKKSFLRLWMYAVKKLGGIGLHAGAKLLKIGRKEIGQLYLGNSATGKSTLTVHGFGLKGDEWAKLCQDDVVGLFPDGSCFGTEGDGIYTKTEGLNPKEQPEIYSAVTKPSAILDNVYVDRKTGKVDFYNYELTSNGRAAIKRKEMPNATKEIDLPLVKQIFFITRNPLVPPIARLMGKQAEIAFMLGESIESSAGDPASAGKRIRIVGTNPFIIGSRAEEGRRFFEIVNKNEIECFLVNTGGVGEGERYEEIGVSDTIGILKDIAREKIRWVYDPDMNLEIPDFIRETKFDPKTRYRKEEFEKRLEAMREERREWLKKFGMEFDELY
ncbi:MAG: phosphoenolpyruvate carboxykinase [Candidatus Syntropharchaeia archaeon]